MKHGTLFLCIVLLSAGALAQRPEDFTLTLESVPGLAAEVVVVGSWKVDGLQGWSWGICHDPARATVSDCRGTLAEPCSDCPSIHCPGDFMTAGENGEPPAYHAVSVHDGGVTQSAVLSLDGAWSLPARDRFEMLRIRYDVIADEVPLEFCGDVGTTGVQIGFSVGDHRYDVGNQQGTTLKTDGCPSLTLRIGAAVPGENPSQARLPILLDTGRDQRISNFQFGVAHEDPAVTVSGVDEGAALVELDATDIFIYSIVEGGVTAGAVLVSLDPQDGDPVIGVLPACMADQEIARVNYRYDCGPFEAKEIHSTATLTGDLGSPAVPITAGSDGVSLTPRVGDGVPFVLVCVEPFVRGDVNHDGIVNISDPVAIAKAIFGIGNKYDVIMLCLDGADVNDDGSLDIADTIYALQYLWNHGPPIPPPNTCGYDTTPSPFPPCAFSACQ